MTEIGLLMDAGAVAFTDVGGSEEPPRLPALHDLRGRPRRARRRSPPGSDAQRRRLHDLGTVRLPARPARRASRWPSASVWSATSRSSRLTGARYHADQISTALSLPALTRAKKAGLRVTAGASIHNLTLNELDIGDFRTFFKLTPPLRSEDDRMAMVAGARRRSHRHHRLVPHAAGRGVQASALRGGRLRRRRA